AEIAGECDVELGGHRDDGDLHPGPRGERLAHPHEGHRVVVDACAYFDQIVQGRSQWTRTADRPAWMPHSRSAPEVWPTSSRRWTAGASGRRPVRPWSTASTSRDA